MQIALLNNFPEEIQGREFEKYQTINYHIVLFVAILIETFWNKIKFLRYDFVYLTIFLIIEIIYLLSRLLIFNDETYDIKGIII